ncbi:MAG: hypothetical protein NT018_08880 [Armatimonadetes bacterium]|nr:hypothetical protein [Armatimonadota bacterium]
MNDNDKVQDNRLSQLSRRIKAKDTMPYGSQHCTYTKQKLQLAMAAIVLRDKGYPDVADYMDAEMKRIQDMPGLESDMLVYIRALADQIGLCLDVWSNCEKHNDLADVIVHLAFGCSNPNGTA